MSIFMGTMTFFTRLAFFFYFTFATVYAGDYKFWISDVDVVITRSPHKDTLLGAIYVNGTGVTPASVIKLLGDQGGFRPSELSTRQLRHRIHCPR